jgi:predicted nucleotidyltransferase
VIKSEPAVRKLFGKRELVIIEKQLLGVALTQSEKNRLSRDIRPKFKAIAALAGFSKEENLKKGSQLLEWIEETKQTVLDSRFGSRVKRIWLFGSTTENKRALRSDVDIAVELDKTDSKEATLFRKEIAAVVPSLMDVLVFNELPPKLQQEIRSKGRVLFEQPH